MEEIIFLGIVKKHHFGPWPFRAQIVQILKGDEPETDGFVVAPEDADNIEEGDERTFKAYTADQFCRLAD